ncbi:UDP-N-acetylglucosamine--dolichyl-phosphate N-acetylglucosaminephosphotransferase [Candidatus Micrarchaeota archaeon]|nr:UDP-N-acetylglucosamine--dolichyl-phosphate N-acetylglucosaminephosphotransferase [Candidatus Micrarchaeota archaeon]
MVQFALFEVFAFSFTLSFLAVFFAVPFVIRNSRHVGLQGVDFNKKDRRKVPELGGIALVFGLSLGLLAAITLGYNTPALEKIFLLGALGTILLMGLMGIIDDLYVLKRRVKAPLPFFSAIPLSSVRAGSRIIDFPFIGPIHFGSFYPVIAIPLGVGGASNAFNMLAGLNGLEAGMGIIMATALSIAAFSTGAWEALILSLCLLASLLAFFHYNRFPSKVFPGDVGTYTIGATIASAAIIGNLELFGLVLFAPYFVEFLLKLRSRFQAQCFGIPDTKGILHSPPHIGSLTHVIMRWQPVTETQVVRVLLAVEAAAAVIALVALPYLI